MVKKKQEILVCECKKKQGGTLYEECQCKPTGRKKREYEQILIKSD